MNSGNNPYDAVMVKTPDRNHFDLSSANKLTMDMGLCVPIFLKEVVPGDSFTVQSEHMIRVAPLLAPVMARLNVYTHYFYVPNRIMWPSWEDFITQSHAGGPSAIPPPFPTYTLPETVGPSSLLDYLGIPTGVYTLADNLEVNALPIMSYYRIWAEWYRDENLQSGLTEREAIVNGGDNSAELNLWGVATGGVAGPPMRRSWRHDKFTSALPWLQKGDPVLLPLGDTAPIIYGPTTADVDLVSRLRNPVIAGHPNSTVTTGVDTGAGPFGTGFELGGAAEFVSIDNSRNLLADLSQAIGASINDLREAFAVQRYLELNARAGTRYTEFLKAHFGVTSDDANIQRSIFLGGGKSAVSISEVLQTSATESEPTGLGTMAGHGIGTGTSHSFSRSFKENGFIIGIMSVMPDTGYMQGLHKLWRKNMPLSFLTPLLAQIGEQPIQTSELYFTGLAETDDDVFGYEPRYAEYRTAYSETHGAFRDTMAFWHFERMFDAPPLLNEAFIQCVPRKDPFPILDEDVIWAFIWHECHANRPLPKYNIPMW